MEINQQSRNIPEPIKREVRQRSGFGCVICGFPLYDYEHMEEWAKVKKHEAKNITLLCPDHHRQVTSGIMPKTIVYRANENPYNHQEGHSTPLTLHYEGTSCEFLIGGNIFSMDYSGNPSQLIAIMVDGNPLLSFILDDGQLLLSARLFDEANYIVCRIEDNELIFSTSPWDIQIVGKKMIIREKSKKILVEIIFEAPNKVIINKARLLCNGVEILINENSMSIAGKQHTSIGCKYHNNHAGIIIGNDPYGIGAGSRIGHVNRYNRNPSKETIELIDKILKNAF